MPRSWEGNRRFGVALAMVTDLSGLSTYGLKGLRKASYTPVGIWHLYFTYWVRGLFFLAVILNINTVQTS